MRRDEENREVDRGARLDYSTLSFDVQGPAKSTV